MRIALLNQNAVENEAWGMGRSDRLRKTSCCFTDLRPNWVTEGLGVEGRARSLFCLAGDPAMGQSSLYQMRSSPPASTR